MYTRENKQKDVVEINLERKEVRSNTKEGTFPPHSTEEK